MPTDQKVEQAWETPSHEEIPGITRAHVAAMEASADDGVWILAGMEHIVVRTVGRRSGEEHKVALPSWRDPDGIRVVVGSFAGHQRHPAWYLNLRDRSEAEVLVHVQGRRYWSVPDILDEGERRDRLWELLVEDRAWYADYQQRTARTIPLVRLPEDRPA